MRAVTLLMTMIFLLPAQVWSQDDDNRVNVTVKTKRASLTTRSLTKIAALALENSPNVAKARNVLEIAKLELENARVAFLPSLDLEAVHGLQDSDPSGKDAATRGPYTSRYNFTLSEPFYDNGVSLTKLRIAEAKAERARMEFEYKRDEQLLAAANAYFDWSASLLQRQIDEVNRETLRKQHFQLDSLYKQGLKTKRDLLRIQTELRRIEIDVLRRDNEIDLGFQKLAGTVGLDRDELAKHDIEAEDTKPYVDTETNFPELRPDQHRRAKILGYTRQVADLEATLERREYWPQLSLDGKLVYQDNSYLGTVSRFGDRQSFAWEALVTLKYNLWDFGTRGRDIQIAEVKARNVGDDNRQILVDLGNHLRDVWNRLREFRESVKMGRELLVIEQQSYSILEAEYRIGRTTYLDLITNLKSWMDARSRFTASYFSWRKQQTLYYFHKGELNEFLK